MVLGPVKQRDTLNREIYSIARLVAGSVLPAGLAMKSLQWATRQLRSYDLRRPWRPGELDKIVRGAFADGLARPRQPERPGPCSVSGNFRFARVPHGETRKPRAA